MDNNIFTRLWAWITGEAAQIPTIESNIVKFADSAVNWLKSPNVQFALSTLTSIAESIDPALTPLIAGIENYIPKIISLITGISNEAGKSVEQQIQDGLAELEKVKGIDGTIYAGLLATIQSALSNYVLSNNAVATGIVSPPAGQLIAVGQAVHANNK